MKRYIALLRGVNVSGKNKIFMPELKLSFVELGYIDVLTHLNSGNVVFSTDDDNETILADKIKGMIKDQFGLDIPVLVILQAELKELLRKAPDWWGTDVKEIYDNLILIMLSTTAEVIAEKIGEPSNGLEQICIGRNAIFWSFNRQEYAKANWWKKTASTGIGGLITIRTANTLKKIVDM